MINVWLLPVLGFLMGSIPFGYLIVKFSEGRDIRGEGSGNIGAANVTRVVGRGAGLVTLALDAGKGWLAVWLTGLVTGGNTTWMAAVALAAILGHLFTPWLKFKGGKGVATGAGAFLAISPAAVGGAFVVWLLIVGIWRYVSLGSMAAAAVLPPLTYAWILYSTEFAPPTLVSLFTTMAALLIIWKHRDNLRRIAAGTEAKFTLRGNRGGNGPDEDGEE